MTRYVEADDEQTLDDIWADEGGVSVRVIRTARAGLRIEFTHGVAEHAEHFATLTGYRAQRLAAALTKAFPSPADPPPSKPWLRRLLGPSR